MGRRKSLTNTNILYNTIQSTRNNQTTAYGYMTSMSTNCYKTHVCVTINTFDTFESQKVNKF